MQQKRRYKRKKLKPKIKIFIFVLLSLFIIHTGNNLLKLSHASKNEISNKTSTQVDNKSKNIVESSVFPKEVYGVPVFTKLIDTNTSARTGEKRIIKYIVIHETDNFEKGVGAANHATFLKNNNKSPTSWHYTVDHKEIYHHIPDDERANHAGDKEGNDYGIGIELCVNEDGNFNQTFDNATKLVAYLLKSYNLDISAIKTHHDFTGKECPHNILKNKRLGEFKEKVRYYIDI